MGSAADSSNLALSRMAIGGTVIAGAAFIGLGALSVKMAADFQQSMTLLVTSAGESQNNLKMVGDGILAMSVQTATSTDKLATAMFTVESAGYHGAAGLKVLQAAAEGAKIENADLAQVTDALTTTMHDWQEPANQAIDVMNSFREAASIGKMRMDDFTGAMKNVGPVASLAKIPLTDIEAALSTMSLEGDKGAAAGTHLAQSLLNMIAPSTKAQKVLKEIGLTAQQVSDDMKKSLPDTLKEITDDIGKKFPKGSEAYNHALSDMFGGTRGLKAILELTGANLKDFTKDAADLAPIMKQNATNVDGWALVQQNFNFQLDAAKNAVEALFIKVGTALLPALTQLLQTVTPLITSFTDWATSGHALNDVINAFNQNTQTLVPILSGLAAVLLAALIPATVTLAGSVIAATWPFLALGVAVGGLVALLLHFHPEITTVSSAFQTMWPIIQNTGIALAVFFTPALIKAGVEAVVSAAKITFNFVASMILTGAQGWAAAGKLAVFIASLIATGAQAVISAARVTISFIASLIATAAAAYASAFAVTGSFVPALGIVGVQALLAAGKLLTGLIPALYATGVAATAALGPLGVLIAVVGLAGIAFIAMKNKSDEMQLGVSGAFDTMGNKIQRSTGRIIATADQMKNGVTTAAEQMAYDAANSSQQMDTNVTVAAQSMAANTLAAFGNIKNQGGQSFADLLSSVDIDMSTLDANAKQYWADVMGYIENNPIVGHVTYTTAGGGVGVQQSPTTAHNAEGTDNWRGGWSWVGERGPELMNIPRGAQIIPHDRSVAAASGGGQPVQININIAGHRVAQTLLPDIVQAVRSHTGVRF